MKKRHYLLLTITYYVITTAMSCANPYGLTGGPADKQAPRLDSAQYSTPSGMTNFKEKEIILTFDEWVKAPNAQTQILISPPTQEPVDIKIRNKSLVLSFNEELRDSTTYIINFGDAVTDITENNPAKNLQFVFATGDELDSLKVRGRVLDAIDGKPKADVWVMLYDQLTDSIPYKERPYYCTKTIQDGTFELGYLRSDSFKIFALDDKNSNYLYDMPTESIAFLDSDFEINDTVQPFIQMRLFLPNLDKRTMSKKETSYGTVKLAFNQELEAVKIRPLKETTLIPQYYEAGKDTAQWWGFLAAKDTLLTFEIEDKQGWRDTVEIRPNTRTEWIENTPKLVVFVPQPPTATGARGENGKKDKKIPTILHPTASLELSFNTPLHKLDTSLIQVWDDSTQQRIFPNYDYATLPTRPFNIDYTWEEGHAYKLYILPKGATDIFRKENTDTIHYEWSIAKADDYGNIVAKVINADSSMAYVLELRNGEKVMATHYFSERSTYEQSYENLPAGAYILRIVHDANRNQKWDNGDYLKAIQPEIITNSKSINLRAGWDNEMELDLSLPVDKKESEKQPSPSPNVGRGTRGW